MLQFIVRNWRLKLLALVLALVAWAVVVYAGNPVGSKTVQVDVPQPPQVSLPGGYALTRPIPPLALTVAGTQSNLSAFVPGFLQLSVNYQVITELGAGVPATVNLPIKVTNSDSNVEIDNPPSSVQADVDRTGSATADVSVVVGTNPPAGYRVGTTLVEPSQVTLTGPEHQLIGAQVRTLPIDLGNQRGNFNETLDVYAYDSEGQQLPDVNTDPLSVDVQISIAAVSTSRTSAVVLGPIRGLGAGDSVTSINYSPMTVTLSGSQDIINDPALATVTTAPVQLNGVTGAVTLTVSIPAPEPGVTVSPLSVTVTLIVEVIPTPTPAPAPTPTPSPPTPSPTPSPGSGT